MIQETDGSVRSEAGEQQNHPMGRFEVPEHRSPSAARLLEMTARDTDQWRSDARAAAAEIVAAAREEAGALVRSAEREAESMVKAARLEAARTVAEAQATADDVRTETEKQRTQGESEIARLQQVAADHSQHLRRHLNETLDRLDSIPAQPDSRRGATS
jgi:cell division septum initiation protein DivIVA